MIGKMKSGILLNYLILFTACVPVPNIISVQLGLSYVSSSTVDFGGGGQGGMGMHYITPRILCQYYQLLKLLCQYNIATLPFIICLIYFSVNIEILVANHVIFIFSMSPNSYLLDVE